MIRAINLIDVIFLTGNLWIELSKIDLCETTPQIRISDCMGTTPGVHSLFVCSGMCDSREFNVVDFTAQFAA